MDDVKEWLESKGIDSEPVFRPDQRKYTLVQLLEMYAKHVGKRKHKDVRHKAIDIVLEGSSKDAIISEIMRIRYDEKSND